MNFEFKVNNKELAKLGLLEIFFKRKLKFHFTRTIQKSINSQPIRKLENVPCDQPWLFL